MEENNTEISGTLSYSGVSHVNTFNKSVGAYNFNSKKAILFAAIDASYSDYVDGSINLLVSRILSDISRNKFFKVDEDGIGVEINDNYEPPNKTIRGTFAFLVNNFNKDLYNFNISAVYDSVDFSFSFLECSYNVFTVTEPKANQIADNPDINKSTTSLIVARFNINATYMSEDAKNSVTDITVSMKIVNKSAPHNVAFSNRITTGIYLNSTFLNIHYMFQDMSLAIDKDYQYRDTKLEKGVYFEDYGIGLDGFNITNAPTAIKMQDHKTTDNSFNISIDHVVTNFKAGETYNIKRDIIEINVLEMLNPGEEHQTSYSFNNQNISDDNKFFKMLENLVSIGDYGNRLSDFFKGILITVYGIDNLYYNGYDKTTFDTNGNNPTTFRIDVIDGEKSVDFYSRVAEIIGTYFSSDSMTLFVRILYVTKHPISNDSGNSGLVLNKYAYVYMCDDNHDELNLYEILDDNEKYIYCRELHIINSEIANFDMNVEQNNNDLYSVPPSFAVEDPYNLENWKTAYYDPETFLEITGINDTNFITGNMSIDISGGNYPRDCIQFTNFYVIENDDFVTKSFDVSQLISKLSSFDLSDNKIPTLLFPAFRESLVQSLPCNVYAYGYSCKRVLEIGNNTGFSVLNFYKELFDSSYVNQSVEFEDNTIHGLEFFFYGRMSNAPSSFRYDVLVNDKNYDASSNTKNLRLTVAGDKHDSSMNGYKHVHKNQTFFDTSYGININLKFPKKDIHEITTYYYKTPANDNPHSPANLEEDLTLYSFTITAGTFITSNGYLEIAVTEKNGVTSSHFISVVVDYSGFTNSYVIKTGRVGSLNGDSAIGNIYGLEIGSTNITNVQLASRITGEYDFSLNMSGSAYYAVVDYSASARSVLVELEDKESTLGYFGPDNVVNNERFTVSDLHLGVNNFKFYVDTFGETDASKGLEDASTNYDFYNIYRKYNTDVSFVDSPLYFTETLGDNDDYIFVASTTDVSFSINYVIKDAYKNTTTKWYTTDASGKNVITDTTSHVIIEIDETKSGKTTPDLYNSVKIDGTIVITNLQAGDNYFNVVVDPSDSTINTLYPRTKRYKIFVGSAAIKSFSIVDQSGNKSDNATQNPLPNPIPSTNYEFKFKYSATSLDFSFNLVDVSTKVERIYFADSGKDISYNSIGVNYRSDPPIDVTVNKSQKIVVSLSYEKDGEPITSKYYFIYSIDAANENIGFTFFPAIGQPMHGEDANDKKYTVSGYTDNKYEEVKFSLTGTKNGVDDFSANDLSYNKISYYNDGVDAWLYTLHANDIILKPHGNIDINAHVTNIQSPLLYADVSLNISNSLIEIINFETVNDISVNYLTDIYIEYDFGGTTGDPEINTTNSFLMERTSIDNDIEEYKINVYRDYKIVGKDKKEYMFTKDYDEITYEDVSSVVMVWDYSNITYYKLLNNVAVQVGDDPEYYLNSGETFPENFEFNIVVNYYDVDDDLLYGNNPLSGAQLRSKLNDKVIDSDEVEYIEIQLKLTPLNDEVHNVITKTIYYQIMRKTEEQPLFYRELVPFNLTLDTGNVYTKFINSEENYEDAIPEGDFLPDQKDNYNTNLQAQFIAEDNIHSVYYVTNEGEDSYGTEMSYETKYISSEVPYVSDSREDSYENQIFHELYTNLIYDAESPSTTVVKIKATRFYKELILKVVDYIRFNSDIDIMPQTLDLSFNIITKEYVNYDFEAGISPLNCSVLRLNEQYKIQGIIDAANVNSDPVDYLEQFFNDASIANIINVPLGTITAMSWTHYNRYVKDVSFSYNISNVIAYPYFYSGDIDASGNGVTARTRLTSDSNLNDPSFIRLVESIDDDYNNVKSAGVEIKQYQYPIGMNIKLAIMIYNSDYSDYVEPSGVNDINQSAGTKLYFSESYLPYIIYASVGDNTGTGVDDPKFNKKAPINDLNVNYYGNVFGTLVGASYNINTNPIIVANQEFMPLITDNGVTVSTTDASYFDAAHINDASYFDVAHTNVSNSESLFFGSNILIKIVSATLKYKSTPQSSSEVVLATNDDISKFYNDVSNNGNMLQDDMSHNHGPKTNRIKGVWDQTIFSKSVNSNLQADLSANLETLKTFMTYPDFTQYDIQIIINGLRNKYTKEPYELYTNDVRNGVFSEANFTYSFSAIAIALDGDNILFPSNLKDFDKQNLYFTYNFSSGFAITSGDYSNAPQPDETLYADVENEQGFSVNPFDSNISEMYLDADHNKSAISINPEPYTPYSRNGLPFRTNLKFF